MTAPNPLTSCLPKFAHLTTNSSLNNSPVRLHFVFTSIMAENHPTSSPASSKSPPPVQSTTNIARTPSTKEALSRTPSSPSMSHRASLAENLRAHPTSPRMAQRHPSINLSQSAVQDLLNNPPRVEKGSDEFKGRDWKGIRVGEIVDLEQVRFAEMTTSVEQATNMLIQSGSPNVVLLTDSPTSRTAIGTFDYSDLNAYLLLVVGLAQPDEDQVSSFRELAQKGREGKPIPLKDVKGLGRKEPLVTLPHTATLTKAVEILGSGVHRIIIVKEHSADAVGVLTQLRLIRFFWENGRHFPGIESLYARNLRDLDMGSRSVFAIHGDKPLATALELMNNEGITSLPVLDNGHNVIGNISHVDVRLLTKNTSLPLLQLPCIHFISVILTERGVSDGKDSYPVFHVSPWSTLAHTVAKLVATRSHRMWIVESPSPASSGPPTPLLTPASVVPPPNPLSGPVISAVSPTAPSAAAPPSLSAAAVPGATLSGRLSGVVSLTDILNLFGKTSGLHPVDPLEMRRFRRRSSSASVRRSVESSRSESVGATSSVGDLSRSASITRR